jgi:hypothetical protein
MNVKIFANAQHAPYVQPFASFPKKSQRTEDGTTIEIK